MSIKVYRYEIEENEQFIGPYNCSNHFGSLRERLGEAHGNRYTHPNVRQDLNGSIYASVIRLEREKFFSACDSPFKLVNWFDGFNEELLNLGFYLVEYTISEVLETNSRKQVLFFEDHVISREIVKYQIN